MKILHVGWGFIPLRIGGLIEYAEDLMELQVQNGHQVYYFCTGRSNLLIKPSIKKWQDKRGFTVFELQNPPILNGFHLGTNTPLLDIEEPVTQGKFLSVVKKINPDIIHFQELVGLPSSIIDSLRELHIKTVFTIHDYYTLCPTFKLVKTDNSRCKIKGSDLEIECAKCCANAPANTSSYKIINTANYFLHNKPYKGLVIKLWDVLKKIRGINSAPATAQQYNGPGNASFVTRRIANLKNLKKFDLLIAVSHKVSDVLNYYDQFDNLVVVHGMLKHIETITPKKIVLDGGKITFGLSNVFSHILKGKQVILDLFGVINTSHLTRGVKFVVLGAVEEEDLAVIKQYSFVEIKGAYKTDKLNHILEESGIQVGIVPSVWEEAYGFVGVEYIAKGIPVIGNKIGGIPEYVVEGETGWLNKSCSANELFSIISELVNNPSNIESLNANIIKNRSRYISTMNEHGNTIAGLYKRLLLQEKIEPVHVHNNTFSRQAL